MSNYCKKNNQNPIVFSLEKLLIDFEQMLDIHLTVHDDLGGLATSTGTSLLKGRNSHRHPYCQWGRHRREWDNNCVQHCVGQVNQALEQAHGPVETCCWKGVREIVVPIFQHGLKTATIFAGGFRAPDDICPLPGNRSQKTYHELRLLHQDEKEQIIRLLFFIGRGMLQIIRDTSGQEQKDDFNRKSQIEQFIYLNAHRPELTLTHLARELSLSPSRTGHIVKENCGATFHHLLTVERLRRVKTLLLTTDYTLEQICGRVGIENVYYLCRIFKKFEKVSTRVYRSRHTESNCIPTRS